MFLFTLLFPILGFILTIFVIYWFYGLVQSNKDIAISQAKIAASLSEILMKLPSKNSVNNNESNKQ